MCPSPPGKLAVDGKCGFVSTAGLETVGNHVEAEIEEAVTVFVSSAIERYVEDDRSVGLEIESGIRVQESGRARFVCETSASDL